MLVEFLWEYIVFTLQGVQQGEGLIIILWTWNDRNEVPINPKNVFPLVKSLYATRKKCRNFLAFG